MASRNQNRPPRSPSTMQKKGGTEELPSDKRRRIGSERVERQGRARVPFGALNNKTDANDVGGAEGSECSTVDFTKKNAFREREAYDDSLGCRPYRPGKGGKAGKKSMISIIKHI